MPPAIAAVVGVVTLMAVLVAVISAVMPGSGEGLCQPPPGSSTADMPHGYPMLYRAAGKEHGIGWHVLAAVGKVESDHGRGPGPGISSGRNHAGAAGPMQFMPGSWAAFGVDGNRDGSKSIYDPADALPADARYLRHGGAPAHLQAALFQYNHSDAYVDKVFQQARAYSRGGADQPEAAAGAGGGGYPALPPSQASTCGRSTHRLEERIRATSSYAGSPCCSSGSSRPPPAPPGRASAASSTGSTWHLTGPTGLFRQLTALTKPERDLLATLNIPARKQVIDLQPAPR